MRSPAEAERRRILAEHRRRERQIDPARYGVTDAAELLARQERNRLAIHLLGAADAFPSAGAAVLEIGCGRLGWLADLVGWGLRAQDLHGVDLDPERIRAARDALPGADLREADASSLPWPDRSFALVILSTVLTSVLDPATRSSIAAEATRVLAPSGVLLWYDFRWNNPANSNVRGIGRRELRTLFSALQGPVRSLTLAPPLARSIAPLSWWLAETLARLPPLRSHLLAVLSRSGSQTAQ